MYQARKKIVPGRTNDLRLCTSSWNSGDRSIASQSMSPPGSGCVLDCRHLSSSFRLNPREAGYPAMRAAYASSCARRGGRGRSPERSSGSGSGSGSGSAPRRRAVAGLLLGGPRLGLARDPRGRHAAGPAAGQQQRHRAEPERLHDRQRAEDRQHDQRAADDAEHAHEAGQQPDAHGVEADHDPAEAERQRRDADRLRAGDPDQLRGDEHGGVADVRGAVDGARARRGSSRSRPTCRS